MSGLRRPISDLLASVGATVFERGWLSSNNVLFHGNGPAALVDTGHFSHAAQTVALVEQALNGEPLGLLLNTHLHSDHCGGNAALQNIYEGLETLIPPGQAAAVAHWDPEALSYGPTGQFCPRFVYQGLLLPGSTVQLGPQPWEVHGATGHDPHSIVLFQRRTRVLISADALWSNGFGVVFPELDDVNAFDDVETTLDLIEDLDPLTVIPGHGSVFEDISDALQRARRRLAQFRQTPERHLRYALKVLIKFHLLSVQRTSFTDLMAWIDQTPYIKRRTPPLPFEAQAWLQQILSELENSMAVKQIDGWVINT
jgi:glyoxylase-like metal-dependent hydrolase (beta-lactamase superfamily II)